MIELIKWMSRKCLKLNEEKTECMMFGKSKTLEMLKEQCNKIKVGSHFVEIKDNVKNIGCYFDEGMKMVNHIKNLTKNCNFHLKRIAKVRKYLNQETAKVLVNAVILSRIDYQNSLLYGLPTEQIKKIQKIQNNAARLICKQKKMSRITPILIRLHWLPVKARIEFKIILLLQKCLLYQKPSYLRDLVTINHNNKYMNLRFYSDGKKLMILRSNNKKEDRQFQIAGPKLYNELPLLLRSNNSIGKFKKDLKTFLFKKYFED